MEDQSRMCVRKSSVVCFGLCAVIMFYFLLILGLFSDCEIGSEGCIALAGALQGHSALQSIDLYGA